MRRSTRAAMNAAPSPASRASLDADSMAVVSVIGALEEQFGIVVEDDEISAETFETVGTLCEFLVKKVEG